MTRYAYRTLLRLYPAPYRTMFGAEMVWVFEQASEACRSRGFIARFTFLCSEYAGLCAGAFSAWTGEYVPRPRPRLTVQFVISILAGAAITAFFQTFVYTGLTRPSKLHPRTPAISPTPHDLMLPMIMAGVVLVFVSVFSVAFVW